MLRHELLRDLLSRFRVASSPAVVDPYIAALGPASFVKFLAECSDPGLSFLIALCKRHQHTDVPL